MLAFLLALLAIIVGALVVALSLATLYFVPLLVGRLASLGQTYREGNGSAWGTGLAVLILAPVVLLLLYAIGRSILG